MGALGCASRWALLALVCTGCSASIEDGHYTCTTPADCPAHYVCRANTSGALRCFAMGVGMDAGGIDGGHVDAGPDVDGGPGVDGGHADAGPIDSGPPVDTGVTCDSTTCGIGGVCYPAHSYDPGNPCAWCDPATSTTMWTGLSGDSCDDGVVASCGKCMSGVCTPMTTCIDSLSCTANVCDDAIGACSAPVAAGSCLIAGVCHGAGDYETIGGCRVCDPAASTTAWSAAGMVTCNDGSSGTCDDVCTGTHCSGFIPDCDDGNPCTVDSVDCSMGDHCNHDPGNDGALCTGPSRGHCCGGSCRDYGNCCSLGGCGFGGVCAGACNSFDCCASCSGTPGTCGA